MQSCSLVEKTREQKWSIFNQSRFVYNSLNWATTVSNYDCMVTNIILGMFSLYNFLGSEREKLRNSLDYNLWNHSFTKLYEKLIILVPCSKSIGHLESIIKEIDPLGMFMALFLLFSSYCPPKKAKLASLQVAVLLCFS